MTPADYARNPHVCLQQHPDGTGVAYFREPGHGDRHVLRVVRVFTPDEMRAATSEDNMAPTHEPTDERALRTPTPDSYTVGSARPLPKDPEVFDPDEAVRPLFDAARWILVGCLLAAGPGLWWLGVVGPLAATCIALAGLAFALLPTGRP